jgi:hypothetical protein
MKKIWIILGAILLSILIAGGSFAGGMAYQRNQADQIRNQFLQSRGLGGGGGDTGGGQRRGFFGGGGATGQIKSIEGNVLTLSTPQNVTTVNLSSSTRIEKAATAEIGDLQPGQQVLVTGERDANGNITASQVMILRSTPPDTGDTP